MTRYLFGFICVCTLGVIPLVGCGDNNGGGGSGGSAGTGGSGASAGAGGTGGDGGTGGTGDTGGSGGSAGTGGSGGMGGDGGNGGSGGFAGTGGSGGMGGDGGNGGSGGTGGIGGSAGTGGGGGVGGSGGSVGDMFPCTEQGIRDAIAEGGGPHRFSCSGPTTVVTAAEIVIDNNVILDGEGNLTVDGDQDHRVVSVAQGVTAELRGLTMIRGTVAFPDGGGGIFNAGELTLIAAVVRENVASPSPCGKGGPCYGIGGGINNQGKLVLLGSTVSENTAQYGGGVSSGDPFTGVGNGTVSVTLTNSTVSGNSAVYVGGGILGGIGTISVTHSTVSGNTALGGSGIGSDPPGGVTVTSSLIDGDCYESIVSNGYNIESPGNTCGFDQTGHQASVPDPMLGPLQNNGGPTMTHALLPGSAALDVIPEAECEVDEDQRGVARPQGSACDVGAFERQTDEP